MTVEASDCPIEFTALNDAFGFGGTRKIWITGIVVEASADNWNLQLQEINDSVGRTIFPAKSIIANHRSVYWTPAKSFSVNNIKATTFTNITRVCIYYDQDR